MWEFLKPPALLPIWPYAEVLAPTGALTVLFLQSVVFGVLDSAVVTFFVCFAEEPEVRPPPRDHTL